jgi:hypothetical protein
MEASLTLVRSQANHSGAVSEITTVKFWRLDLTSVVERVFSEKRILDY